MKLAKIFNRKLKLNMESLMTFILVFFVFCRLFKIADMAKIIVVFFGLSLMLLCFSLRFGHKIYLWKLDYIWILSLFLFFHKNENYSFFLIVILLMGYCMMYACRSNLNYMKAALLAIVVFSVFNYLVTVISLLDIEAYEKIVQVFLVPEYADEAVGSTKYGYITGLAEHYSRNAYFCVAGLSVFFSVALAGKLNQSKFYWALTIAELVMIMRIGKRGHLLFVIASILFIVLMTEKKTSKKMKRLLQFLLVSVIFGQIIMKTVPDAMFVFDRVFKMLKTNDYTQSRFTLWAQGLQWFMKKPILGIGYGTFSVQETSIMGDSFAGVHNDYIQWLCEGGIIGFLINMIIAIGSYWITLKVFGIFVIAKEKERTLPRVLIIWSLFFQTFVLTYSMTGLPHYDYEINIIYLLSCSVPIALLKLPECRKLKIKVKTIGAR